MVAWVVLLSVSGPGRFIPSPDLDANEQAALERLQEARRDPAGLMDRWIAVYEAERVEFADACDDGPGMLRDLKRVEPRPPLAPSQALTDAARRHTRDMIDRRYFEHTTPEGVGANQRAIAAGYDLPLRVGIVPVGKGRWATYSDRRDANQVEAIHFHESLATGPGPAPPTAADWVHGVDSLIVDRCVSGQGHRHHLLGVEGIATADREVGIGGAVWSGVVPDDPRFSGWQLKLAIETGARVDDRFHVVGVVFEDRDGDGAYDAGEGIAGAEVSVPVAGVFTRTAPGGGYVVPLTDRFAGTVVVDGEESRVAIRGQNVKLDRRR